MAPVTGYQRLSATVELDTETVSPDSLKASFEVAVDALLQRADRLSLGLDWTTLELAMVPRWRETLVVVRAEVLT